MLNGLDLFSGIGGITLALEEWVSPIAYCECDRYAQAVLLSRMANWTLPAAPIWDDVRTLKGNMFDVPIDIIYGGFPCQDISVAGNQKGLEGKRSGLFYEIIRLCDELRPAFVFLENVPGIRTRGLDRVLQEFTKRRYDCRWTMLSASSLGANHRRERWFFLGYSEHNGSLAIKKQRRSGEAFCKSQKRQDQACEFEGASTSSMLSDANGSRIPLQSEQKQQQKKAFINDDGTQESLADSSGFGGGGGGGRIRKNA